MSVERLLWENDAVALAGMVNRGEVKPAELVEAAIERLEAVNPEINAVAEKLYDDARRRAASLDRSLPLAGVPFAIKDLGVAIKGVPPTAAAASRPSCPTTIRHWSSVSSRPGWCRSRPPPRPNTGCAW
jgi:amidase